MQENAIVIKANNNAVSGKSIAVIKILKHAECDGCKACAFRSGKNYVTLKALNRINAKVGDNVIVKTEKDNRLFASFLVYVVPLLVGFLGLLIGTFAFEKEIFSIILCLSGIILGYIIVVVIDKIVGKRNGFGLEITQILDKIKEEQ